MKTTLTAAIYTRVSTREQAEEGYSLDAQERLLMDYCKSHRYQVYKIYSDEGISAKDIRHRPGMIALLADAQEKRFNLILVWKLTRFSRSLADLTASCEMLDKLGIALISYSEAFDSYTPAGRMVRSMLGTVAQFEREVTAENVALGMLERARQGKRTCTDVLGYDPAGKDSFQINPEEAKYVNFVFDNYLLRKNISEVAALCREMGFRGKRGKIPCPESIHKILTRPIYAGYNVYKGNIYKGNYESIRTVQDFNKVQRLILRQGKISGRERQKKLFILPEGDNS